MVRFGELVCGVSNGKTSNCAGARLGWLLVAMGYNYLFASLQLLSEVQFH